jgi:Mn-dependent DtxR family transcriptional regulator
MKESINFKIEQRIKKTDLQKLVMLSDFKDLGPSTAIRKTLSRLTDQGIIERIGRGIYTKTKKDSKFGKVFPSIEKISEDLASREFVTIKPTGQYALNKLGLSTQVQMKYVFLTSGNKKNIKLGKSHIVFKSTTSKKLSMIGPISSLLFIALEEINLNKISSQEINRILSLLEKENLNNLKHDLKLASSRISDFVYKNYLKKYNDRVDQQFNE